MSGEEDVCQFNARSDRKLWISANCKAAYLSELGRTRNHTALAGAAKGRETALKLTAFFDGLVAHLRERRADVAQLATMAATEHWVQFEAAALLAGEKSRRAYGIGGGTAKDPGWWVTCEHAKIDLLVQRGRVADAIEFKAIHNNKNFYSKVREARRDLAKKIAQDLRHARRTVIAVVTHALYGDSPRYVPLRDPPRKGEVPAKRFKRFLACELMSRDRFYDGWAPARIVRWAPVAFLKNAPYVTGRGAFVALALIRRRGR